MKKIITLSAAAFLSTALFASTDMEAKIDALEAKITKLEKAQKKQKKKLSKVNALAAKDNIKFDVDFRTSVDKLNYETASGKHYSNDSLMVNRLWLGMGYAPTQNILFRGQLSVNKAFGASYGQRGTGFGFDTFDWVVNETLTDDTIKLREAYWLWTDKFGDIGVTASVGRRPATNGFLSNLREDDKSKSPMGHVINMEFDGASASVKLDAYVPGMMFKVCLGRGLTNAVGWSSQATQYVGSPTGGSTQPNYTEDENNLDTVDMAGFIFKPYDDGQYSVVTTWYRGFNLPGLYLSDYSLGADGVPNTADDVQTWSMQSGGAMDGMAISLKVDGIGDGINDFLDDTTVFASFAMTKSEEGITVDRTAMAAGTVAAMGIDGGMLGNSDAKTGYSRWFGIQTPNLTGGKFGLEYNHGSKYWRPFTYGEDTMIGSKIATRGTAIEAYWTQPLIENAFSMQVRYTSITYDYTGSNAFFGDGGTPFSMSEARALGMDPVEKAQDLRIYFRYRY